jgi:hypothetical protein
MTSAQANPNRMAIEREVRAKAKRKVGNRLGLMWHAAVYVMANAAMIAINLNYSPKTLWFVWPTAAWGAALLLHAFAALQVGGISQRMVDEEVDREMARRGLT